MAVPKICFHLTKTLQFCTLLSTCQLPPRLLLHKRWFLPIHIFLFVWESAPQFTHPKFPVSQRRFPFCVPFLPLVPRPSSPFSPSPPPSVVPPAPGLVVCGRPLLPLPSFKPCLTFSPFPPSRELFSRTPHSKYSPTFFSVSTLPSRPNGVDDLSFPFRFLGLVIVAVHFPIVSFSSFPNELWI